MVGGVELKPQLPKQSLPIQAESLPSQTLFVAAVLTPCNVLQQHRYTQDQKILCNIARSSPLVP